MNQPILSTFATEAKRELEKVFLMRMEGVEVDMFSGMIDSVWHELLDDPSSYEDFCIKSCGHIVGHKKEDGRGRVQFVKSYEARFGQLPRIWFYDKYGQFMRDQWEIYNKTGQIEASWECQPTHNCMEIREQRKDKPNPEEKKEEKQKNPDISEQSK